MMIKRQGTNETSTSQDSTISSMSRRSLSNLLPFGRSRSTRASFSVSSITLDDNSGGSTNNNRRKSWNIGKSASAVFSIRAPKASQLEEDKELTTVHSPEELEDVIASLAQATPRTDVRATLEERIQLVKEFWRLINMQEFHLAYALVEDDTLGIHKDWNLILPKIQPHSDPKVAPYVSFATQRQSSTRSFDQDLSESAASQLW